MDESTDRGGFRTVPNGRISVFGPAVPNRSEGGEGSQRLICFFTEIRVYAFLYLRYHGHTTLRLYLYTTIRKGDAEARHRYGFFL